MARKAVNTANAFAYAPIIKYEDLDNGNLLVFGKATDDTLDSDEQICDPVWLDRAMPEWFKFGNIREQHSAIAAGVATEYQRKDDGHYIAVEVVDEGSKKKVKAKVLKGFSIGIKRPRVIKDNKAVGGRIVDGEIVEVSLVDRPANPSCVLTVAKSVDNGTLMQVEEFTKGVDMERELIADETVVAAPLPYDEEDVLALAKSINEVTVTKFDAEAFADARRALARLVAVEANELAEGHDERHSLWALLNAINSLLDWQAGEVAEGEVIEMSDVADTAKCLECGCHQPADSHGSDEVSTAEVGTPKMEDGAEEEKSMCKECMKALDECECEMSMAVDSELDKVSGLKDFVESLVKSLLSNEGGDEAKATDPSEERIKALEEELEKVKSLAISGGPSRLGASSNKSESDEVAVRAKLLLAKAEQTQDKQLAEGYRLMANDLLKSVK